jgi:hypothetical protein
MDEAKLQEIIAAARAERAAGSRVGNDLQRLVEVAETLAGTIARGLFGGPPVLATVTGTVIPGRVNAAGVLSAPSGVSPFPRRDGDPRAAHNYRDRRQR